MMSKRKGFTIVELLVVIGIIVLLVAILVPALNRARERARRVKCASNLRQIGIALNTYANDNKGQYPRTIYKPGVAVTVFVPDMWRANNDVTAPLYLLIEYRLLTKEVFLCPSVDNPIESELSGVANFRWAWPAASLLNYSWANPYPVCSSITTPGMLEYQPPPKQPPGFAVASDRNDAKIPALRSALVAPRLWNSRNHGGDGQNVLYNDGHVSWADTPLCGYLGDNIFAVGPLPQMQTDGPPFHRHDTHMLPHRRWWLGAGWAEQP